MNPLAERVLCAVEVLLGRIATADRYATDAGLCVLRARRSLDPADLPALVLWDEGEEIRDGSGSGNHASMTLTLRLTVDAHAPADQTDTGAVLEALKADVKRAVLGGAREGLVDADGPLGVLAYTGATPSARADGAASEAISLQFEATYKESYGDPTRAR